MIQGRVAQIWKDRVEFCERNLPSFKKVRADDDNSGEYRYCMFTILTQHEYGNSITELIDEGMAQEDLKE